ncbi:MAG: hypothetical protein H7X70_05555 [Candidatus Kapabacteria bacterium]|nr:hypothetical protein [Candidatus Kapabacteria bacterium]
MRLLVSLIVLFIAAQHVRSQGADVSAERVSMDAKLLRAIDGTSSLGSAAVWPQSVYALTDLARDTNDAFGNYIKSYYGSTLLNAPVTRQLEFAQTTGGRFRGMSYADSIARLQGDISLMLRPGYYNNGTTSDPFILLRPAVRFMGSLGNNLGFFLDLSNGMRLSGDPALIARTDPTLSRTLKFNIEDSAFFDRYVGYIQYQNEWLRVRFGREALQFGLSPIDTFVHSIDAPLMDGLLIDVPYKSVRFTMTHSAANGVDTAGKAVPGKYIATHRLAFDPVDWLSVSVNDMIVYWGRGLDFSYLNPLAFFVSAGLGTEERNANDNSMIGFDLAIRPMPGSMFYGSIIIDDLSFGSLGDTSIAGNNNKFAYQLGYSQAFGSPGAAQRSLLTLEYARVDPFTFSHRSNNASYTTLGSPVGYELPPNADRISLQARHWFSPRTFIRLDLDYTRHGENILDSTGALVMGEDPRFPGSGKMVPVGNTGGDVLRGDGDFLYGNSFLRGNASHQRRVRLWFSAEWWSNVFSDLRVGYANRNGGNNPEEFFFASFEIRIGY